MNCVHARQSELEKMGAPALSHLVLAQMERIENLELQVAKFRRAQFGPKSEKAAFNQDQLALCLSGCVIESQQPVQAEQQQVSVEKPARAQNKSRALPPHLPREVRTYLPKDTKCPCCDGELRKLGEDTSEMIEYMPASFFVIRHVRPKMSCRKCSCVVQAPAAGARDRPRTTWAELTCAYDHCKILRPFSSPSSVADFCSRRCRVGSLDSRPVGWRSRSAAGACG
jgi:zinc-finger binding domain of transposase IS66/Transposase C of IS166 homeodomain